MILDEPEIDIPPIIVHRVIVNWLGPLTDDVRAEYDRLISTDGNIKWSGQLGLDRTTLQLYRAEPLAVPDGWAAHSEEIDLLSDGQDADEALALARTLVSIGRRASTHPVFDYANPLLVWVYERMSERIADGQLDRLGSPDVDELRRRIAERVSEVDAIIGPDEEWTVSADDWIDRLSPSRRALTTALLEDVDAARAARDRLREAPAIDDSDDRQELALDLDDWDRRSRTARSIRLDLDKARVALGALEHEVWDVSEQ